MLWDYDYETETFERPYTEPGDFKKYFPEAVKNRNLNEIRYWLLDQLVQKISDVVWMIDQRPKRIARRLEAFAETIDAEVEKRGLVKSTAPYRKAENYKEEKDAEAGT